MQSKVIILIMVPKLEETNLGLTEESWKLYAQFIKDNQNTFKEICEKEILPGDPQLSGRRIITHQNPEMNFLIETVKIIEKFIDFLFSVISNSN